MPPRLLKYREDGPGRVLRDTTITTRRWLATPLRNHGLVPRAARHRVTVVDQPPMLWYQVAKVGTRSIKAQFQANGITAKDRYFAVDASLRYRRHLAFAFVRNPWDRLVSAWHDKVGKRDYFGFGTETRAEMTFPRFIDYVETLDLTWCDVHLRRQAALIDLNRIDFLGTLETFDADARDLFTRAGLTYHDEIRKNVTATREDFRTYYIDDDAARVARLYDADIRIFGYTFDSPTRR